MGNCVETCTQQHPLPPAAAGKEDGGGGVQIKVVLTKEELEWLLLQLSTTDATTTSTNTPTAARLGSQSVLGNNKLEEFLMVIERARKERNGKSNSAEVSWKPSLESITEAPEYLEMDRS